MSSVIALAIYCALLGLLAIGVWYRPPVALTAVMCIYGLKQWGQSTSSWLAANAPFTNIAIGILTLLAIVISAARGRCILCKIPRVTYLIVLLLIYSWVSLQWVSVPDVAEPLWELQFPYLVTFILLVPVLIQEPEDYLIAMRWLLYVGGPLVIVLLVYGNWGIRGLYVGAQRWENESNPLALASLGGTVAIVAMLFGARKASILSLTLRLTLLSAGLLLIVRSGSRGQLIGAALASLAMLPVAFKLTSFRGLAAVAAGVFVLVGSILYGLSKLIVGLGFGEDRWNQSNSIADAAGRWDNVTALLTHWNKSATTIIFGLGNSASFSPSIGGFYPHNVPAEVLGEEGLLGFLIYSWILVECTRSLINASVISRANQENRTVVAIAGAQLLFAFFLTLKEGNMIGSVEFFLFAILISRLERSLRAPAAAEHADAGDLTARSEPFPNLLR